MDYRNDVAITQLDQAGLKPRTIAAKLGVPVDSVKDRLKKLAATQNTSQDNSVWHAYYRACIVCHTTTYNHYKRGVCLRCFHTDQSYKPESGLDSWPKSSQTNIAACMICAATHNLRLLIFTDPTKSIERTAAICSDCHHRINHCKNSPHKIMRWCGKNRIRIPDIVLWASAPIDADCAKRSHTTPATVLVLGAGGFVGRNLCSWLRGHYDVIAAGRADCNIMNDISLRSYLRRKRPDVVVNLAAFVGGIGLNKNNPADMIQRNLIMSAQVIDACYTYGVRKLVTLGSVCSYPHTPNHIPFLEDDLWYGRPEPTNEPYGLAKKTAGLMLDAYQRQYNFRSAYLIPTNMYGAYDDFSTQSSHVIPAMIRKFTEAAATGTKVTLWGNGSPSRDFLHVNDCCEAIRLAIEKIDIPDPINIGSGVETVMRDLAAQIAVIAGYEGDIIWDTSKPNGQPRRCLDVSAAMTKLKFKSNTDLESGLRQTMNWYKENEHNH